VYIGRDDTLIITTIGRTAGTCRFFGRLLRADDGVIVPITFDFAMVAAGGTSQFPLQLSEGFLLSCGLLTQTFSAGAMNYATVQIARPLSAAGPATYETLVAGYLNVDYPITYPEGGLVRRTDGQGMLRTVSGSVPAAGADISETVPTGERFRLISVRAQLTTSAGVANRNAALLLDDGVNFIQLNASPFDQAASLIWNYCWMDGIAASNSATSKIVNLGIASNTFLDAGFHIRTTTQNLQVGDQWTAPIYTFMEWWREAP
jgi:hypothetical protein